MLAVWDAKANFESYKGKKFFDCFIAEFLLNEGRSLPKQETTLTEYGVTSLNDLAARQSEKLKTLPKVEELFFKIEMPLIEVLDTMEQKGICVDTKQLQTISKTLSDAIRELQEIILKEIGYEINLASPAQVGSYLAEIGVPLSKTKTGQYATNENELLKFAEQFPIVKKILDLRELAKLQSTYTDRLVEKIDSSGRIHTTYSQVGVSTGRLSSSNPNLQNIPVTSQVGKQIKACFTAGDGNSLLAFDYSQQELRILAHLTGEEKLIEAFNNGRDIHKLTASQIFHVDYEVVTKEQRYIAKTINFGIIYGMSSYGLSMQLSIPSEEAEVFIKNFYNTFPKIKSYYDQYLKDAAKNKYAETLLGRRRFVFNYPGQKFLDNSTRRVLMNYPIQGTAAELMKMAMIKVYNSIIKERDDISLLLQIHDELIFEVIDDKAVITQLTKEITECMSSIYPLAVPMEVEARIGKRWEK